MRRWRKVIGLKEPAVRSVHRTVCGDDDESLITCRPEMADGKEQCVDREGKLTTGDQD